MEYVRAHGRPTLAFKDILKERHIESDLLWVSREFHWKKAYRRSNSLISLFHLQEEVLTSPRILKLVEEEAKEKGILQKDVQLKVENILKEISCSKRLPVVRWLGYVLLKIMKQTVSALYVNEEKLLKIAERMGSNPVLFLPSHRSYADFILMAFVMFNYSVDIPCVAAGMDFHSMWLMGRLLRDCSAFFMRRSFADDNLYRTVFDEYIKKLICLGEAPVEFFIEGTRSRSAKSLMPKFGLLTMVMETLYMGEVPDITIVPVNISYDRTIEEVLFAYEMLGIAKPKESTSGLIKGINMLDEKYGCVYMDFCEPISAHQFVWQLSNNKVSYTSRDLRREQEQIVHLAHCVVNSQQKHAVLSCFNILALVLSSHLLTCDTSLPLSEAIRDVTWISSVLSTLGAYVRIEGTSEKSLKQALAVHKSLVKLSGDSIQLVNVHSPTYKVDPNRVKGHRLEDSSMSRAVPMLMLQLYVNPCLHSLVIPAIVTVVALRRADAACITKGELFKGYKFLRAILRHEFVLYNKWEVQEFEDALVKLEQLKVLESDSAEMLKLGSEEKLQLMLCHWLYPFLSGYLSLAHCLLQMSAEPLSERQLASCCQQKVESELRTKVIHSPYSLSLDLISCALSSLTQLKALSRLRGNGCVKYVVIHERLSPLLDELERLIVQPVGLSEADRPSRKVVVANTVSTRAKL